MNRTLMVCCLIFSLFSMVTLNADNLIVKSNNIQYNPLVDATHATHPFNYESYSEKYPKSTVLELNFKKKFLDKSFTEIENTVETSFNIKSNISVLGFRIEYRGSWGRMGSKICFPNGTEMEVFDDTISRNKAWYFHFHNPSQGKWSLKVTVSEQASINVIVGECSEPINKEVLNEHDFLILCSPSQSYSKREKRIIHEFIKEGGDILVAGESGESLCGKNINKILETFGIKFNGGLIDPTNNRGEGLDFQPILHNFTGHPIALRAKELRVDKLTVFAGGCLEITNPNVQVVIRGDKDTSAHPTYKEGEFPPFAATLIHQKGRLFVQGDSSPEGGEEGSWKKGWYQAIAEWLTKIRETAIELNVEIDYMPEHRPTGEVLNYIKEYYSNRGISLVFHLDDEVELDENLTTSEFWEYEEKYNDLGNDMVTRNWWRMEYKIKNKWKWILYGTISARGANGLTYAATEDAGNYIFIADKENDKYATIDDEWVPPDKEVNIEPDEVEKVVLMHEFGHAIGILKLDKKRNEIYDSNSWSVMDKLNRKNCNSDPIRYSKEYWKLRNVEYYKKK